MAKTEQAVDQTIEGTADVVSNSGPAQADEPSLALQDLAIILNLLNVAIKRGAYETKELRGVLDTFEKLENFLQYSAQMQAAQQAAQKGDA